MGGGQVRETALGFLLLCPFLPPSNQLPLLARCQVPPSLLLVHRHTLTLTHFKSLPLCICPSSAPTVGPFSREEYWGQCLVTWADWL